MIKLLAWVQVHAQTATEIRRVERWRAAHPEITGFFGQINLEFDVEGEDSEDDLIPTGNARCG